MITSTKNPRIQFIRKIQSSSRARRQEKVFVIEGLRLVEESQKAGWLPNLVLYTEALSDRGQQIIQNFSIKGIDIIRAAPHVMQAASDTQTPQGILAIYPIQILPNPEEINFIIILDQIRDPGNLGTILRTAQAAGTDAVILTPNTVDPFSPKVIRSAMGAHFNISITRHKWQDIQQLCDSLRLELFLADASSGQSHLASDFQGPLGIIIGGEAEGASQEARNFADKKVQIPMVPGIESLNSAVAAAILMFEVFRQRRNIQSPVQKKH